MPPAQPLRQSTIICGKLSLPLEQPLGPLTLIGEKSSLSPARPVRRLKPTYGRLISPPAQPLRPARKLSDTLQALEAARIAEPPTPAPTITAVPTPTPTTPTSRILSNTRTDSRTHSNTHAYPDAHGRSRATPQQPGLQRGSGRHQFRLCFTASADHPGGSGSSSGNHRKPPLLLGGRPHSRHGNWRSPPPGDQATGPRLRLMMEISPASDRPQRTNTPAYLTLPFVLREIDRIPPWAPTCHSRGGGNLAPTTVRPGGNRRARSTTRSPSTPGPTQHSPRPCPSSLWPGWRSLPALSPLAPP